MRDTCSKYFQYYIQRNHFCNIFLKHFYQYLDERNVQYGIPYEGLAQSVEQRKIQQSYLAQIDAAILIVKAWLSRRLWVRVPYPSLVSNSKFIHITKNSGLFFLADEAT